MNMKKTVNTNITLLIILRKKNSITPRGVSGSKFKKSKKFHHLLFLNPYKIFAIKIFILNLIFISSYLSFDERLLESWITFNITLIIYIKIK